MRLLMLAVLGILPLPGASAPSTVTECDRLAGHPSDPDKVTEGRESEQIDAKAAILACERDVAAEPGNARVRYELGRVLFYDKQTEKALSHLKAAADAGYRQAQFVYGFVFADGRNGLKKDMCTTARYWKGAAEKGHYASEVSLSRGSLKGFFSGCETAVSREDARRYLDSAATKAKTYYERLLIEDLKEAATRP